MEAWGDRRCCFSHCQITCHLTGSFGKKRGLRNSKRQTEARRTVKQLSMGFSVTASALLLSLPACLRDWQSPQPIWSYPRQGCRIIPTASKRRSAWQPRACCQEASGQDFLPKEISSCQSERDRRTTWKMRLSDISQADDTVRTSQHFSQSAPSPKSRSKEEGPQHKDPNTCPLHV